MFESLPPATAYAIIQRDRAGAEARFAARRDVQAEVARFEERAAGISDVEALLRDRRVLEPLLAAFGLESEIDKRAIIRKVLTENPNDPASLANRLSDQRWRTLAQAFGGRGAAPLADAAFRGRIVEGFVTAAFEKREGGSGGLREALYFQRNAAQAGSVVALLADRPLAEVVRTALGLPDQFGLLEFDQQRTILEQRFDPEQLQDPQLVDRLARRYLARRAMADGAEAANPLLTLFQPMGTGLNLSI